jgi:hypothetical protein
MSNKKILELDDDEDMFFEEPSRPGRGGKKPTTTGKAAPVASQSIFSRLFSGVARAQNQWSDKLFPHVMSTFHFVGGWAWIAFTGLVVLAAPLAIADQQALMMEEAFRQESMAAGGIPPAQGR